MQTLKTYIDYGILPMLFMTYIYWLLCVIFMMADHYCDIFNLYTKWKHQGKSLQNGIDWKKYRRTIRLVLFNQFIVSLPLTLLMVSYNIEMNTNALPYRYLPFQIMAILFTEDLLFYICHRLFHVKIFYKYIHSIHHEWTIPVAMRTIYAHPLEHLLCNLLPVILTGHLFKLDWVCYNIWLIIATLNATFVHSDYNIRGLGKEHNEHHKYRTVHYGTSGYIDYLLGTNSK